MECGFCGNECNTRRCANCGGVVLDKHLSMYRHCATCDRIQYVKVGVSGRQYLVDPDTGDGINYLRMHYGCRRARYGLIQSLKMIVLRLIWRFTDD